MTLWCLAATLAARQRIPGRQGLRISRRYRKRACSPARLFRCSPAQTQIFWAFYWMMTGIHAIHLTIGIGIVATVTVLLYRRVLPLESPSFQGTRALLAFRRFDLGGAAAALVLDRPRMKNENRAMHLWLMPSRSGSHYSFCWACRSAPPISNWAHSTRRSIWRSPRSRSRWSSCFSCNWTLSSALLRLASVAGLFWLVLMFGLTASDYLTRP